MCGVFDGNHKGEKRCQEEGYKMLGAGKILDPTARVAFIIEKVMLKKHC